MSSNDTDTTADVEPVARDEAREQLLGTIRGYLGDAVVGSHILPGRDLWVRVTNEAWAEAAETVRYAMGARYFGFLSAIDWMPSPFGRSMDSEVDRLVKGESEKAPTAQTTGYAGGDTRFQAIARVANLRDGWGVTFKADLADDAPSIATWTPGPTGTSARCTKCSASSSSDTRRCARSTCRPTSRGIRSARTSRCWPAW